MRSCAAAGCGALSLLALPCACTGGVDRAEIERRAGALDPDLDCSDLSRLWPAEVRTRTDNVYVQRSTTPLQYCFNCTNFERAGSDRTCGTCRTVKGPINPGGWCKTWTARA